MKKSIFLFVLLLLIGSNTIYSQALQSYIVEFDTLVNLDKYMDSNKFIDKEKIKNDKNDKLKFIKNLIEGTKLVTMKKLLTNLSSDVTYLKTRRGINFDVTNFQKQFVIKTKDKIKKEKIKDLKTKNKHIKNIIEDIQFSKNNWPPNDSLYQQQIQFYNTTYNIDLPRAWNYTTGNSGIKIGVVDDGIDYMHIDLGNGMGPGFRIRGGWDFIENDPYPMPSANHVHGTKIAGILGALNNNAEGVIGIAGGWGSINSGCQLFAFKTGNTSSFTDAIFEASSDPALNNGFGYGINVLNNSNTANFILKWFGLYRGSQELDFYNAHVFAYLNNVLTVVSRGNFYGTAKNAPSNYANGNVLLSVSGVDNDGNLHPVSMYGDGVSISAPYYIDKTTTPNNGYNSFSGTSNAAPFVAGVGALVFSKYLERGTSVYAEDVQNILKISAEETTEPDKYGAGRLDAGQALYISSEPFVLEHHTADINRTVTTVANPAGDIMTLYYPYDTYIVAETKKITATIRIPNEFNLDSTWVWANSYTWGLEWGNPSYGIPNATIVSRVGADVTFETYCYRMMPVGGSNLDWYPADPNDPQAQIKVTILGKKEFAVSISGPTFLNPNQNGTWTAGVSGGITPYSYNWWYKYPGLLPKISSINKPPAGYWNLLGNHTSQITRYDTQDFELKCVVTDNVSSTVTSNILYVSVGGFAANKNPDIYDLGQNNPNPFNPNTIIRFQLPQEGLVTLKIFDMLGREVRTLVNEHKNAGEYKINFDASTLSSGVYVYRLQVNGFMSTKKMLLMK